jgi:hypothetical protein
MPPVPAVTFAASGMLASACNELTSYCGISVITG